MSRVLHAVCTTPWWILPSSLDTILEIAARDHDVAPESIERMRAERHDEAPRVRVRDRTAILSVRGPIFRYANLFTALSGATSSEMLANDLGTALRDPKIQSIILEVDSPGGMVNGTGELAKLIYDARGEKPLTAFISGTGASAAYYIASAADQVLADRSAIVGSIGTILEVVDFKRMDEKRGIRTHEFVSAQSPRKRMDPFDEDPGRRDEARAELQSLVNDLAQVFIEDVARNRSVSVETVLDDFGMGGVFVGEDALEAGLVDGMTTLEDLLAQSTQDRRPRGSAGLRPAAAASHEPHEPDTKETVMSDTTDTPAAAQQPVIDRAYLDANHPELVTAIRAEGATDERERVEAIRALHGPEELKAECIADATCSAGDAALKINAAQAAADGERAKVHLKERAGAEDEIDAPGPSAESDKGDVEQTVARVLAVHRAMKGQSPQAEA